MVFVYVLSNDINDEWYTGMALDYSNRLKEHNQGKNRYTKAFLPWELLYFEETPDWKSGRIREKYLKSSAGKKWLRKKLDL
jgi:putative endonuclease